MGNCSTPSHFVPEMLEQILQETFALGGPLLGRLCAALLDMDVHCRASMVHVIAELSGGVARGSPLPPRASNSEGPRVPPSGRAQSSTAPLAKVPLPPKALAQDWRSTMWASRSVECSPGSSRGLLRSQSSSFCAPSRRVESLGSHCGAPRDRPPRPASTTAARNFVASHVQDTSVAFVAPPPRRASMRRLEGIEAIPGALATASIAAAAATAAAAAGAAAPPFAVSMPTALTPGVRGPLRSASSTPSPLPVRQPQPSLASAYTAKHLPVFRRVQ